VDKSQRAARVEQPGGNEVIGGRRRRNQIEVGERRRMPKVGLGAEQRDTAGQRSGLARHPAKPDHDAAGDSLRRERADLRRRGRRRREPVRAYRGDQLREQDGFPPVT